jgi:hypothetical protein
VSEPDEGPSHEQRGRDVLIAEPVLIATLAAICIVVAFIGVPRMRIYGHDVFVSLDGAWRVLHGQRPVVDFFAQMGPAYYLLHAAGLRLAGYDARGLGYGTTLVAVLISVWSFFLLRARMVRLTLFLATVSLVLLAVAPFPLGHMPWDDSFAMKHNRYEYAITGLVLLECFLGPGGTETRRRQFASGFSSGIACALLLFLKISYGLVALVLIAVSAVFRSRERVRLAGVAVGMASFLLPMLAYLRFDIPALLREFRLLAAVRGSAVSFWQIITRWYLDRFEVLLLPVLAVLVSFLPGVATRRRIELWTATALAIGAGTLLLMTNTQPSMYPLNGAMALILMSEIDRLRRAGPSLAANSLATNSLVTICALVVAIPLFLDSSGLILAAGDKLLRPDALEVYRLDGAHLDALEFADSTAVMETLAREDNGQLLAENVNEGFALLRANSGPTETVRGMGMSNPFSYGLLRPPSHGGSVVISATDVSESAVPPMELLVGDADLLLVPKFPDFDRETLHIVTAKYPDLLGRIYSPVAESEHWLLFRRVRRGKDDPPPSSPAIAHQISGTQ